MAWAAIGLLYLKVRIERRVGWNFNILDTSEESGAAQWGGNLSSQKQNLQQGFGCPQFRATEVHSRHRPAWGHEAGRAYGKALTWRAGHTEREVTW